MRVGGRAALGRRRSATHCLRNEWLIAVIARERRAGLDLPHCACCAPHSKRAGESMYAVRPQLWLAGLSNAGRAGSLQQVPLSREPPPCSPRICERDEPRADCGATWARYTAAEDGSTGAVDRPLRRAASRLAMTRAPRVRSARHDRGRHEADEARWRRQLCEIGDVHGARPRSLRRGPAAVGGRAPRLLQHARTCCAPRRTTIAAALAIAPPAAGWKRRPLGLWAACA